jgi:hypothetical protein
VIPALIRAASRPVGVVAYLLCLSAATASAQSLQVGRLEGSARDATRRPIANAEVRVEERASGATRFAVTSRDGSFRFGALPEGRYDVTVEALGFVPVVQLDIRVGAGPIAGLDLTLRSAEGVVTEVDTVPRRGSASETADWLIARGYADLVGLRRTGADFTAFSTTADANSVEGLPWRYSGTLVDGANGSVLAAPSGTGADAAGLAFPVRAFSGASVGGLGFDVEVAGSGIGIRGATRRGGRTPNVRAGLEGGDGNVGAAYTLSGPLQGDTAQAMVGADFQRFDRDFSGAANSEDPRRDERAALFGRFDWQASDRLAISARASGNRYTSVGIPERDGLASYYGRDYEAVAGQAAFNVFGQINRRFAHEWRVSTDFATATGDNGDTFRADAVNALTRRGRSANESFDEARTTPRVSGMLHAEFGAHRFKAGFASAAHRVDSRFIRDGDGALAAGDLLVGLTGPGAWRRVESTPTAGEFRMSETALFIQDAWQLADGLSLLLGARFDRSRIPVGDIEPNGAWLAASGLDNTDVRRTRSGLSPRIGLRWELGDDGAWVIEGGAGTYRDLPDIRDIAEALTLDRGTDVRYGIGQLPIAGVPSAIDAPVVGTTLTMLAPSFTGPRTQRLSLGLTRRSGLWSGSLSGVYRHTDFLTRRRDLNLPATRVGIDQYDRALYGTLSMQGAALAVIPQSNRRFAAFDAVHLLESTGFSEFWGVTAAIERVQERGLSGAVQYTYSQTTDNIPGFVGTRLTPFPDGLEGRDWSVGRSDLDIPHRLLVALDWRAGERLTLGAVYRLQSGMPFTPGLPTGVDANGDGDWSNDPAYVDASLPGLDAIIANQRCVRRNAGGYVARNSCRDEVTNRLDLRLALAVSRGWFGTVDLVVDALDVIAPTVGTLDRALLRVDTGSSITTDPGTGVTTLPFAANPNFGTRFTTPTPSIFWRIGLRITP